MSVKAVKEYLSKWNIEDRVQEFEISSATVELAAQAVGGEGKRIAKTLSFKIDDQAILIVMAGDARIDNKKYKERFHKKAAMLKQDEVEEMTGHPVGGVCPFAVKEGVDIYLDESLRRFETVYPACGSANSAIGVTIEELEKYTGSCGWVDVGKDWA